MPILGLIDDVESLIFSYITEVPDILRLLRVNSIFRRKAPLYISHLTWKRLTNRPVVPTEFFIMLKNIRTSDVPVFMTGIDQVLSVVRMAHISNIILVLNTQSWGWQMYNPEYNQENKKGYDGLCIEPILQHVRPDCSVRIEVYTACTLTPLSYEEGIEINIDTHNVEMFINPNIRLSAYQDELNLISKYRTIKHLKATTSRMGRLTIPSLETFETDGSSRDPSTVVLHDIVYFINRHPKLRSFKVDHLTLPLYWSRDTMPVINRSFELLIKCSVKSIPTLLLHFPMLTKVILYIECQSDFNMYWNYIQRNFIDRGTICILKMYGKDFTDQVKQLCSHPLVTLDPTL